MRVNYTPNFKATFAEDFETRKCLRELGNSQGYFPIKIAQKAMKDIPVRDTLCLSKHNDCFVVTNHSNKRRVFLSRNEKDTLNKLIDVIFDKSYGLFTIDKAPKKSQKVYIEEVLKDISMNPEKMLSGIDFFNRKSKYTEREFMRINFNNPSYSPNFRAHFAKDPITKANVAAIALENPTYTLASHMALKDIKSHDEIALSYKDNGSIVAQNLITGSQAVLSNDLANVPVSLLALFTQDSQAQKFFNTKDTPKWGIVEYVSKAMEQLTPKQKLIEKAELNTMKNELSSLVEKRDTLQKKIDILTKKIDTQDVDVCSHVGQAVYDIVYNRK